MSSPIVHLQHANIAPTKKIILQDVSFEIWPGDFIFLIGKTGSGKSSLLRTLYADIPLHSGKATVLGYDLSCLKRKKIPLLRRNMGIVFQDFQLLFDRSVAENLYFVLQAVGCSKAVIDTKITEALIHVGLANKIDKMPHELSGGEQQKVAIARALLNDPHILLADEPTGNLDPAIAQEIMQLFLDIHWGGTTIIMATHNYTFLDLFSKKKIFRCEDQQLFITSSSVVS